MSARLEWNGYGKSRVRVMRVARGADGHALSDLTVAIQLEGDFESVHTRGDNSSCLPTDTMKNTVYVLSKQRGLEEAEDFALALARHFVAGHAFVASARVDVEERRWSRLEVAGRPHPHAFVLAEGGDTRTARARVDRERERVESGLADLLILKTTGSAFAGFARDRFTTLPEASDRIFATRVRATWRGAHDGLVTDGGERAWGEMWLAARTALVEAFAGHDASQSVQHSLYAMGESVLARCAAIDSIDLSLPNVHCLLVDLARFGLANDNEVFVPTDEPHGLIEARIRRARGAG